MEKLVIKQHDDYENCGNILRIEVRKSSKRGTSIKIILIVLGALVATEGIIDQLMVDYESNRVLNNIVLVVFTLIGLSISILAGFEAAFKYAEKAAGLRMLSGQIQGNLRDSMSESAFSFYMPKFEEAMISLRQTIKEQNKKLSQIYEKAATFGLDLASEVRSELVKEPVTV